MLRSSRTIQLLLVASLPCLGCPFLLLVSPLFYQPQPRGRPPKSGWHRKKGRGVWESNPPGTAPSDPPAVLKTVGPTGAPTPPCSSLQGVLCHSCLFLSSASMPCRATLLAQPTLKFPGMVECVPC